MEAQAERVAARQRARADVSKLLATFAAGVSGGLVASALQTGQSPSTWDYVSAYGLAVTVVLTALVVLLDRLTEPDHSQVLSQAVLGGWDDARRLFELRKAALAANHANEGVLSAIRVAMWLQLVAAVFTGFAGAYSMLSGLA